MVRKEGEDVYRTEESKGSTQVNEVMSTICALSEAATNADTIKISKFHLPLLHIRVGPSHAAGVDLGFYGPDDLHRMACYGTLGGLVALLTNQTSVYFICFLLAYRPVTRASQSAGSIRAQAHKRLMVSTVNFIFLPRSLRIE